MGLFFDMNDGDFCHKISDNMYMDSDGDMMMKMSDNGYGHRRDALSNR